MKRVSPRRRGQHSPDQYQQRKFTSQQVQGIEKAKEEAFDRIMHSANMVKEVLQRNLLLSEDLVKSNQEIDNLNKDMFSLQQENQEVRERLNIIETLTGKDAQAITEKLKTVNHGSSYHERDGATEQNPPSEELMKVLSDDDTAENFYRNKDKILGSLYSLTKHKSILQKRVENLEKSKIRSNQFRMTLSNRFGGGDDMYRTQYQRPNNKKATIDEAPEDAEPVRSVVNEDDKILTKMRKKWSKDTPADYESSVPHSRQSRNEEQWS